MPHGQRDWGNIGAEQTVHGMDDMAELAARLWSPVTFNREGNVLYMTTWDYGFQEWSNAALGTDNDIRISAQKAKIGPYSVCMVPGTDGARLAYLEKTFSYPVLSRFGLEFSFQVTGSLDRIDIQLAVYDGAELTNYILRYDDVNDRLQARDENGTYQTFASSVTVRKESTLFHTVKLVSALDTGYYSRFTLDETEHDLTAYQAQVTADLTDPSVKVYIAVYTQSGKATTLYLDDLVLTQNEP